MSEIQEKVWVVVRESWIKATDEYKAVPVKVFDDRADARAYAKQKRDRAKAAGYWVVGVKKG